MGGARGAPEHLLDLLGQILEHLPLRPAQEERLRQLLKPQRGRFARWEVQTGLDRAFKALFEGTLVPEVTRQCELEDGPQIQHPILQRCPRQGDSTVRFEAAERFGRVGVGIADEASLIEQEQTKLNTLVMLNISDDQLIRCQYHVMSVDRSQGLFPA